MGRSSQTKIIGAKLGEERPNDASRGWIIIILFFS
jgi:hypothetical protein